jgi:hypothetical protein
MLFHEYELTVLCSLYSMNLKVTILIVLSRLLSFLFCGNAYLTSLWLFYGCSFAVNVTKTFMDMKQMERSNEREAFLLARKLRKCSVMVQ